MLGLGISTVLDQGSLETLLGTQLFLSAAYILIATGAVVVFLSFLGCCGAIKEVKCMLLTVSRMDDKNERDKFNGMSSTHYSLIL